MEAPQCQPAAGALRVVIDSPRTSHQSQLRGQPTMPAAPSKSDSVAPIFDREQKLHCAAPESARAATNAQGPPLALQPICSARWDRSQGSGRQLSLGRDLTMVRVNANVGPEL